MTTPSSSFEQLKHILTDDVISRSITRRTDQFAVKMGRRPRILFIGSTSDNVDGVDDLTPIAFSQWGFDVDIHTLAQSVEQTARTAMENDVHAILFPYDRNKAGALVAELLEVVAVESRGTILTVAWRRLPDDFGGKDSGAGFDRLLSIGHEILPEILGLLDRAEENQRAPLDLKGYLDGIVAGDRAVIARAITLVESTRYEHQQAADQLIGKLVPLSSNTLHIGISGVPGAGKSTFIETFGVMLADMGHRVAVLAVDPSSSITGGSVLGDKTRMGQLADKPNAFIRPTASGGSLGGITNKTRESIIICDAAGFDVVLVETVGVGQSETSVATMVDFFMVLLVAGAGDELQGIKKGILELSHAIIINKADGNNIERVMEAQRIYQSALSIIQQDSPLWAVPVLTCSSLTREGISDIWETISDFRSKMEASGEFEKQRRRQSVDWMWTRIEEGLKHQFYQKAEINAKIEEITDAVIKGRISPTAAAFELLDFTS